MIYTNVGKRAIRSGMIKGKGHSIKRPKQVYNKLRVIKNLGLTQIFLELFMK